MKRTDPGLAREASALHESLLVINGLDASIPSEAILGAMRRGGVRANMATMDLGVASAQHRFFHEHAGQVVKAGSVAQIESAHRAGELVLIPCWQRIELYRDSVEALHGYHALGLRSAGLVYNIGNFVGSGCLDPQPGPLSRFGAEVVRSLQELRIVVDVGGHTSEATAFDALSMTRGPVVCSHTNPRGLRNVRRNMSDELLRAIATRGGVIGITAFNFFLLEHTSSPPVPAPLSEFLRHIDYVVQLVGDEHVGLGLDQVVGRRSAGPVSPLFFPPDVYPQLGEDWIYAEYLEDLGGVPRITAGLLEMGYSPERIARIMGKNWLRVWRDVWGE